jgi:hypothetical protein
VHRRLHEVARIGTLQVELDQRKRRLSTQPLPRKDISQVQRGTRTPPVYYPARGTHTSSSPTPSPAPPPLPSCSVSTSQSEVPAAEQAARVDAEEPALLDTPARSTRSKRDKGKAVRPLITELFHEGRPSLSSESRKKSRSTTSSTRSREWYLSPLSRAKEVVDTEKAELVTESLATSFQLETPRKNSTSRICPPSPPSS